MKSNVKSFIDQFVAHLKGDTDTVLAEKTLRQAKSGLESHISVYKGETLDLEDEVLKATENLALARINSGKAITSREDYVSKLIDAKNTLLKAQNTLIKHNKKIEFLESELKNLN